MSVEFTKRLEKLAYEISVSGHTLVSDVNEKLGGDDKGPSPHGLLESALAACTSITVQMYANRKGFPLKSVHVKVQITQEGLENQISREVNFEGELLTEEQRTSMLTIAQKCPIHLFLERGAKIQTRLV